MTARQAIVVIHGMGEQRPVETLNRFSRVITPEGKTFYSKVNRLTDSFESRRHLIPTQPGLGKQTEIYEYHWAHLMRGNQLGDLVPLLRRMLLPIPGWWGTPLTLIAVGSAFFVFMSMIGPPEPVLETWTEILLWVIGLAGIAFAARYVPVGLLVVWLVLWVGIGWVTWAVVWGPLSAVVSGIESDTIRALLGGGLTAFAIMYLVGRALPRWLASSFVDVVRYLDTSPRSYQVRSEIRAGIVDLLRAIHEYGRYERVMVVAHSLGSYIAYDAIAYLWSEMAKLHAGRPKGEGYEPEGLSPAGLRELEEAASAIDGSAETLDAFRAAQRGLWVGLRKHGNPWLITDFVSFGSPMYFADRLYTRDRREFCDRVRRDELVTCPPQKERKPGNNINGTALFYSWNNRGRRVLHDAAPFAVVRWTNFWFPAAAGFFGDWFGGRLAPLFGKGVTDVPVSGNRPYRWIPGAAHALYLGFPKDRGPGSFTSLLGEVLDINAASWLPDRDGVGRVDPGTADRDLDIENH